MSLLYVILIGALVGFIDSSTKATRLGLWWTVYIGVTGSVIAHCIMIYGYFFSYIPFRVLLGVNFFSFGVSVTGAFVCIYLLTLSMEFNSLKTQP